MGDGIETREAELLGVYVCVMRLGRDIGFGMSPRGAEAAAEIALDALMDGIAASEPQVCALEWEQ
jgi:hypothetical protein